jgi:hypothetical protein
VGSKEGGMIRKRFHLKDKVAIILAWYEKGKQRSFSARAGE